MNMEARMLLKPLDDLRMLVRRVVLADQMQLLVLGRLAVDLPQEVEPFDTAVTLSTAGNYRTVQCVHRCEQGGRTIALVVVGHR